MINTRKTGAFTLVELMIVVAIIGLLVSLAVPNFLKVRATARKNMCLNSLRQIESAKEQWAIENNKTSSDTPTADDLDDYIKGDITKLKCPEGGTTFADSYTVNAVGTDAACKKSPTTHKIDR